MASKPKVAWDTVPPGHFTDPVRAWFGQGWKPLSLWGKDLVKHRASATKGRETMLARGETGAIGGISRKADLGIDMYHRILVAKAIQAKKKAR